MTPDDTIGSPVGSPIQLPRGAESWTPAQLRKWVWTGVDPTPKKRPVPPKLRIEVWDRDKGICGLCHEPADPLDWAADHIVPEALGGPTIAHNLRVSHPLCNWRRPKPALMTEEDIEDAAMDWTANEMAALGRYRLGWL